MSSGGKPWLAVMADSRTAPRSGQINPEPTRRKWGSDQQPFDLLVRVVGQCAKTIQLGFVPALLGSDLDPSHDAVGAGRRRDLDAVALAGKPLDDGSEVDRRAVQRDPNGFDSTSRLARDQAGQSEGEQEG